MSDFTFLHTTGKLLSITGKPLDSDLLKGKVVLVVNVASRCGLTPQYTQLVDLHDKYHAKGFTVLGVPCNQFGRQEPGTAEQIQQFCSSRYGVQFPLLQKQDVNGNTRSSLYRVLVGQGPDITWNFEKFLLSRDGRVVERFSPSVAPLDTAITAAIEKVL